MEGPGLGPIGPPVAPMALLGPSEDLWVQHWPEKSLHIRSTTSFTTSSLNYKKSHVSRGEILKVNILLMIHQLEEAESGVYSLHKH